MGIIASRYFNFAYIVLDSTFVLLFIGLLCWRRRYLTTLWGLFGGILYFFVDYCVFYLWTGSRSIEGGNMFWTLLWMSMSYGFTNFAWIWLCLDKDRDLKEWTILIFSWWIACPMIAGMIPSPVIHIQRTTGAYHGIMGAILFVSYLGVIVYNLSRRDSGSKISILWLCAIGVAVQFGWEFALLVGKIRSTGIALPEQIRTLVVNSLVETNLGMPLIYLIHKFFKDHYTEDLKHV